MKKTTTQKHLHLTLLLFAGAIAILNFSCNNRDNDLRAVRNSWSAYIGCQDVRYQFSALGGIDEFDVPVRNNTEYLLDEVSVMISYIKKAGGVFKTEKVTIRNIPPYSVKTARAPKSNRDTSVDLKISEVFSKGMQLCYPNNNLDAADPYFCK